MIFFDKIFRPKCDEPRLKELIILDIERRLNNKDVYRENLIEKYSSKIKKIINEDAEKYIQSIFIKMTENYLEIIKKSTSPELAKNYFKKAIILSQIAIKNNIETKEIDSMKESSINIVIKKYQESIKRLPGNSVLLTNFNLFKKQFNLNE